MATSSGTTVFEKTFTIDDIIEESFERIGLINNTGNQMKAARRSLNIMFQEWATEVFIIGKLHKIYFNGSKVNLFIQFIDLQEMVLQMEHLVI
jgi:hypothetical protein